MKTKSKKIKSAKSAKQPTISKADYVRGIPHKIKAKEVVEKAKEAGIKLSANYVYLLRSKANKGKKSAGGRGVHHNDASSTQLRRLMVTLGIDMSEEILADVKSRLEQLIAG